MKIEIDLPDWAVKRAKYQTIVVLIGQELLAFQESGKEMKVKRDRCVQCGECCLETPKKHTPFGSDDELKCNALYKQGDKWLCGAGAKKPFKCLADPMKANVPGCAIRYF